MLEKFFYKLLRIEWRKYKFFYLHEFKARMLMGL